MVRKYVFSGLQKSSARMFFFKIKPYFPRNKIVEQKIKLDGHCFVLCSILFSGFLGGSWMLLQEAQPDGRDKLMLEALVTSRGEVVVLPWIFADAQLVKDKKQTI